MTPGLTLDMDVQYIFLSAEVASCQGLRGKSVLFCSPKDRTVVFFLSQSNFPPDILHYAAQLPPQPAQWELREKEQKHPQGETVWYKGMIKHRYPQLKAKCRKYRLSLSSWPWVTLQKPGGSSGQPGHQD